MVIRSVRTHIAQATQVAQNRPSYAAGVRAAIATVVPIVAGASLGWHEALWMGLAGFNVVLADRGGSVQQRLDAMLSATIYGAIAAVAGALAGRNVVLAVAGITLCALAAGLARTYGAIATTTGVISVATYAVSVSIAAPDTAAAFARGGGILAGSAFAIALALLLWPMRIYRPVRIAVARAYRALATSSEDARDAIDEARMALAALRRGLNAETPRGERLLILVETADHLLDESTRDRITLEAIARAVESERNDSLPDATSLDGVLRDAVIAAREMNGEAPRASDFVPRFKQRYVDPIRGNLVWSSVVLRHALRVAVAAGAAQAIAYASHIDRGYWMTLSVIIILQPYTSATFQKGLQRTVGTIAGGFVAAALLALVHSPLQMTILIFAGAALTVALLPVNYGLYSLFLTPTFILLAELNAVDRHLIWLRVNNTLLGAAIAYAAAWILWPASERGRVRDDLAAALRALGDYARCAGECDDVHAAASRRDALVALQNSEVSLQRLLADSDGHETTEPLMSVLAYAKRTALALSALTASASDRLRLGPLMRHASDTLLEIASSIERSAAPPSLRDDENARAFDGADRLLDPVAALHRSVTRLAECG